MMKQKRLRINDIKQAKSKTLILAISLLCTIACVRSQGRTHLDQAAKLESRADFDGALTVYEKIFTTSSNKEMVLLSAHKAQEIAYLQTKDYRKARKYLEYIIANAKSYTQTLEAQKKLAYLEHKLLNLYEPAIISYHRLVNSYRLEKEEENQYRLEIARCQFAINEFERAIEELDRLEGATLPEELTMSAKMLRANIFQSQGNTSAALAAMDTIMQLKLSDENRKEVVLNKAIILEHQEKYKEALQALEQIAAPNSLIEDKKIQLQRLVKFQRSRKHER